jgi:hypothetical protein
VFPSPLVLLGGIKRRYQNAQSTEKSGWWWTHAPYAPHRTRPIQNQKNNTL